MRASRGELLAFTDDDCRLHRDHTNDLLRHAAGDTELVLRGGRIELGDPTDLPQTINTRPTPMRWSRALNSARDEAINGKINGCNMTMQRALLDRVGLFDEDFGPGSRVGSGDDTEFMYRVYVAGIAIDIVGSNGRLRRERDDGLGRWGDAVACLKKSIEEHPLRHPKDVLAHIDWVRVDEMLAAFLSEKRGVLVSVPNQECGLNLRKDESA